MSRDQIQNASFNMVEQNVDFAIAMFDSKTDTWEAPPPDIVKS